MQNTAKWQAPKWYDRDRWAYTVDRKFVKECAWWLKLVAWQVFCTFTFAWRVSDQQAEKTFAEFINRLERTLKADVAFVCGSEKRFSGCGMSACGRHFHVLLASAAPLQPLFLEEIWKSMAGNRSDDAGALVKPYDPSRNGAEYVLKSAPKEGDWTFRNLHLFHPEAGTLYHVNARLRRRAARHKERQ